MAGPTSAGVLQSVADAINGLKTTAEKLGSQFPTAEKAGSAEPPVPDEASTAAHWAREKYDGILRWILGVFAVIGILIFGSLAFVDLKNVDFFPRAAAGLTLAGLGLAVVVWATTHGLEPQDASLGELKLTLEKPKVKKRLKWLWFYAKRRAADELKETLGSPEREAHLGPGIQSVSELIVKIGELENQVLSAQVGWKAAETAPARTEEGAEAQQVASVTAANTVDSCVRDVLDDSLKVQTALRTLRADETDVALKEGYSSQIRAQIERYKDFAALLSSTERVKNEGIVAAKSKLLDEYLSHRQLLLAESGVSQLRGTFRFVRGWMLLGALLTLVGGLLYAFAISNPRVEQGVYSGVVVSINKDTEAWKALKNCRTGDGPISGLTALLLSSDDSDGLQNGPFKIVTTQAVDQPNCAGTVVEVEEGGGSYVKAQPTPGADDTTTSAPKGEPSTKGVLVSVTIKENSTAWKLLSACRVGTVGDITGLLALLRSANDDDANQDGPYVVETADPRCSGEVATVENGDGSVEKLARP